MPSSARPGGAAALNEAGSGRRARGAEAGGRRFLDGGAFLPPPPGRGRPSAPPRPPRPASAAAGIRARLTCRAGGRAGARAPPGRARAPGEVAAGRAGAPAARGPGGSRAGGGGDASAAEFATAPLPHACVGCDIAAATKEEVEVEATAVAEQVAHALRGKPARDPQWKAEKLMRQVWVALCGEDAEGRREPRQGAIPEWSARGQPCSRSFRFESPAVLSPVALRVCPLALCEPDSGVHCGIRADHCESLSGWWVTAQVLSQPRPSWILIKAKS